MAGFHKFHVRFFRDSFNTPWGFRLQGGKDLNQALSVQRIFHTDKQGNLQVSQVSPSLALPSPQTETHTDTEETSTTTKKVFSNTPAEGELQRGDVIVSIGERSGEDLTHKQAKDLIEGGGGQINLVVTRGGPAPQQPPPGRHDVRGQQTAPTFRTPAPVAPRTNPPKAMPYGGGGHTAGHKPKKLNLTKLGGGGPDFGSDFSRPYTTAPPQQTSRPSYRPVGGGQNNPQMLNRVQESLDSIIYSPRTPDAYQAPPFQQPAPPPPFQPNMSMSGYVPQQSAPPPQQSYQQQQGGYRPTYEQIDSGQYQDGEQEEYVPVWERRKTFQDHRPTKSMSVRSTPVPRVPRPVAHHPDAPSFGVDYSQGRGQAAPVKWAPQRGPPTQPNQPVQCEAPVYPVEAETMAPWRETLKTTGVKPWDVDLDYGAQQATPSAQTQSAQAPGKPMKEGDRDWNASAVYRMIHQDDRRPQGPPAPKPKPMAAPSYQPQQQYSSPGGYEDELGVSDF